MSGGHFDYNQHRIEDIKEGFERIISRLDKPITNNHYYDEESSLSEYVENKEKFKEQLELGISILELAKIYTQRVDWFISGDDGEETFYERLEEDLKENNLPSLEELNQFFKN